jgi:ketosteroid isomerase-like protein
VDKDKQSVRPPNSAPAAAGDRSQPSRGYSEKSTSRDGTPAPGISAKRESDELYDLLPELRPPKLSPEAIAAAMQAMQIDPHEMDTGGSRDVNSEDAFEQQACNACGRQNRRGNKFCAMCGAPLDAKASSMKNVSPDSPLPNALTPDVMASSSAVEPDESANGAHHYHHHYHHHFFPGAQDGTTARAPIVVSRDAEKLRAAPGVKNESMSRGEAAVRRATQEWVLACNTKHLDDLLDLYAADALVMRANYPSVRGAAAIREFFFSALDSGLGEVEIEPLRVEVIGAIAYEAGRCKALVSGGLVGKRREERGKYLWVLAKQDNGEWKLVADCWSSDLTLTTEPEVSLAGGAKLNAPRKNS